MPSPLRRLPPAPVAGHLAFRPRLESLDDRITPAVAFNPATTFAAGNAPTAMAAGDFNGDGRADAVATSEAANTVSVLLNGTLDEGNANDGIPTFGVGVPFAVGTGPTAVAVGDFDGDGRYDLAVVNQADNTVSVLRNTTAPAAASFAFAAKVDLAVGTTPRGLAVGDLNGDGRTDFAVTNSGGNSVSVLENTTVPGAATPTFAPKQDATVGSGPRGLVAADFDRDGRADLAAANSGGNSVAVLENATTSVIGFAPQLSLPVGSFPVSVAAADLDGDGKPDLVVLNFGDGTVSALRNTSTAGVSSFAAMQAITYGSGSVTVADFDGDGRPDLAISDEVAGTVTILRNTSTVGAISFAARQTLATGYASHDTTAADFDGDGKLDLAVTFRVYGAPSVSVLRNTSTVGAISFAAPQSLAASYGAYWVAAADFDGDGKTDLAVAHQGRGDVPGSSGVSVWRNTSTVGSITFAAPRKFATGNDVRSITVADFDGDGRPDVAVTATVGVVSVLRSVPTVPVTGPAVVVSRGSQGVWAYDRIANDWKQLLSTPVTRMASTANGNVIAVFPGYGTYYYRASDNSWTRLLAVAANAVAIDRLGNAYANFTGYGTYIYRPSGLTLANPANGWALLAGTNAQADELVASANGDVAADFIYAGVWRYRPTVGWVLLNGVPAAALAIGDNGQVVVSFTAQATGVYQWRDGPTPGWALLHGYNATNLAVDGNGNVTATFNSPTLPGGVQVARSSAHPNNTTINWTTIHQGTVATSIATDLFGNAYFYLNGYGVYEYSVYPGYHRRSAFDIVAASIGR